MFSKYQGRYVKRAIGVKVLFDKNTELVTSFKPLDSERNRMLENLALVESELPEKDVNGEGDTSAKDAMKLVVAGESSSVCGIAKSYAVATGNTELAAIMGCSFSEVARMKDTDVLGWVTKQHELLMPLVGDKVFDEYGITAEVLEAMLADAQKFNDMLGKGKAKDKNSEVANNNINAAIKAINGNIKQFDLLIMHFAKTKPDFVKQYFATKKINDAGVKHSGVAGTVTVKATGQPAEKAVVRLADTPKMTKSSLRGVYEIIKVRAGEYKLEVVMNDVVVKAIVVDIERGKILELDIAV